MDKYNINFPMNTIDQDMKRLINQLWKLIPMRENGEDWKTHLKTMLEEISGLVRIYKLEGLTSDVCNDFMIYRKTVFRCIDLLTQVVRND